MRKGFFLLAGIAALTVAVMVPFNTFATTFGKSTQSHAPHVFFHKNHKQPNAKALSSTSANTTGTNVTYQGGPVMGGTTNVYAIFWEPTGSTVAPNYNTLIERYFGDVGGSPLYAIAQQYKDAQGNFPQGSHLAGTWVDTGSYPETPLLDADIQNEVSHAQTTNGWQSGIDNIFFVFLGQSEDLCFDSTHAQCASNTFCAYHSFFSTNTIYAAMPYAASFQCNPEATATAVGPNNNDADQTINVASHEQMEAATDPLLNAWIAPNDPTGGEIGDKCNFTFGPNVNAQGADVVFNNNSYLVQQEWNNAINGCSLSINPPATYYHIVNHNSNLVMDVFNGGTNAGANVIQWPNNGGPNQKWALVPDGAFFQIVNLKSGLVMDVSGGSANAGAQAIQWTNNNTPNQQWFLVPDGAFDVIVNVNSGLVMDVFGGGATQGVDVIQFPFHDGANQQWTFAPDTTPRYSIKNVNSNLVMDVSGGGTSAGTNVIQWTNNTTPNQQWILVTDGSAYQIVNFKSGLVLDVSGGGKNAGAQVIQWTNNTTPNQQWNLLPSASSCVSGGTCQIQNVNSGLVLDVSGGSTTLGADVIQFTNNNTSNQQWILSQVS